MREKKSHREHKNHQRPSVLLVTNRMDAGGAETHILSLAKALMQKGCFVAIASGGGLFENELKKRGILHIEAPLYSKLPHNILRSAFILRRAVKKYGFEIVHAHARLAALSARMITKGGILAIRGKACPRFVTTAHLDFPITPLTKPLSYWGERTLAVSEDLREYLIKGYGLSYETIDVTINGIDTEYFSKSERPTAVTDEKDGVFEIVHVSRIDKDRALTAYKLLSLLPGLVEKHKVHLTVVGGGELFHDLSLRAEKIRLLYGNCVELVGERDDVLPYLKRADLAIGVSRAALEAMSTSLPTILSGNDGYLGIFDESKLALAARTNFCCRGEEKPSEKKLLCDILTVLQKSKEERQILANISRNTVIEHYSIERMCDDHLAFYEKIRPYTRKKYNENLILGYHGYGNAGDDAVLEKMIEGIRKIRTENGITVLSGNTKKTERTFPVSAIKRYRPIPLLLAVFKADYLWVGGGTLLQTKTSHRSLAYYLTVIRLAKFFGKTVIYWANGIGDLSPKAQLTVAKVLATKSVITVRDKASYDKVIAMLAKIPHKKRFFWQENRRSRYVLEVADSAATQKPCTDTHRSAMLGKFKDKPYLLIATNGCALKKKNTKQEKKLLKAILLASQKGLFPLFVEMHPKKDRALTKRLSKALAKRGVRSLTLTPTPSEALGLIKGCEFLLTMRYHPLLFASLAGKRALAYSDDEKILTLAKEAFGEEAVLRADKDGARLVEAVASLLIVKTLPDEVKLFSPDPYYRDELKAKAETAPERIEAALLKLAIHSHKKSSLALPKEHKKREA